MEAYCITRHRALSLNSGMIDDLGPHAFVIVACLACKEAAPTRASFKRIRVEGVRVAHYIGSPIDGDTFATIKATTVIKRRRVPVSIRIGKGIGETDRKVAVIEGEGGHCYHVDFVTGDCRLGYQGTWHPPERKVTKEHTDSMLRHILVDNGDVAAAPGIQSLEAGAEMVRILDACHRHDRAEPSHPVVYIAGTDNERLVTTPSIDDLMDDTVDPFTVDPLVMETLKRWAEIYNTVARAVAEAAAARTR